MRLRVRIPTVEPTVMKPPVECPYEECEGQWFKTNQQHCEKALRDTQYAQVEV